jgi:hypothetical protein
MSEQVKQPKQPKKVASSLESLDSSVPWQRILDGNDPCDELAQELLGHWGYDLYARSPRRALLEDGVLRPTDLDLACFLSALADRGAIIDLPTYDIRRPATKREGEHVVSRDHRHGKVLGLVSNKKVFSFSVRISDLNVVYKASICIGCNGKRRVSKDLVDFFGAEPIVDENGLVACPKCGGEGRVASADGEEEQAGAPRNFMLVDLNGKWHDGWKSIVFSPSRKENSFLDDHSLYTGNTIFFENFIHPNRWVSFYGKWYLLTKLLCERYRAEAHFYGTEVTRLQDAGIKFPETGLGAEKEWGESEVVGASTSIQVPAFEAEIEADLPHSFPAVPDSQAGLVAAKARMNHLRFTVVPALSFATRATELAFCNKADSFAWLPDSGREHGLPPFPSWISGAAWDHDHKIKRTIWNRLVLGKHAPFVKGMALRYRVYKKSERVAG